MSGCVARQVSVSVWCLSSQFRLLQVCENRQHQGSLEGIDALLGLSLISLFVHHLHCPPFASTSSVMIYVNFTAMLHEQKQINRSAMLMSTVMCLESAHFCSLQCSEWVYLNKSTTDQLQIPDIDYLTD